MLRAGRLEEFLHAEQGFAVPAEIRVFRLSHDIQDGSDVVRLGVDHPFLQVCVADIGVGMVNDINSLDLARHGQSPLFFRRQCDDFVDHSIERMFCQFPFGKNGFVLLYEKNCRLSAFGGKAAARDVKLR